MDRIRFFHPIPPPRQGWLGRESGFPSHRPFPTTDGTNIVRPGAPVRRIIAPELPRDPLHTPQASVSHPSGNGPQNHSMVPIPRES